jgi:hypothetical protein
LPDDAPTAPLAKEPSAKTEVEMRREARARAHEKYVPIRQRSEFYGTVVQRSRASLHRSLKGLRMLRVGSGGIVPVFCGTLRVSNDILGYLRCLTVSEDILRILS